MALEKYFKNMNPLDFCRAYPLEAKVSNTRILAKSTMEGSAHEKKDEFRVVHGIIRKRKPEEANQELRSNYIDPSQFRNRMSCPQYYVCDIKPYHSTQSRNHFPLFYLHWGENMTQRIKLTSSVYPANFFITAGINGCSISIEGSEESPVIYHSNAGGLSVAKDPQMSAEENIQHRFNVKGDHMLDEVKSTSTPISYAKVTQGKYIKGTDYLDLTGPDKQVADRVFQENIRGATGVHRHLFRRKSSARTITNGTVFGVRDTRTRKWKFYLQKRIVGVVRFTFPKLLKGLFKGRQEEFYAYQYPLGVQEIWPGGGRSHSYIHLNPRIIN